MDFDLNKDGAITEQEIHKKIEIEDAKNRNYREDAQRRMAWFSLFGMLLYPGAVVLCSFLELDKAAEILGDMAPTYFVSVAAIVAAFYGKEAYISKKKDI